MALLLRVLHDAFPGMLFQWQQIIVFLSVASMLLGSFAAIGQTSIKRLLAFSSIANVGFILIGLAAGTEYGVSSVLIYLAIYVVMTLGSFAVVLAMRRKDEMDETIGSLAGLSQTNLPMAVAFAALLFSLAASRRSPVLRQVLRPRRGHQGGVYTACHYRRARECRRRVLLPARRKDHVLRRTADKFTEAEPAVRWVMAASALLVTFYVVYPSALLDAAGSAARALVP